MLTEAELVDALPAMHKFALKLTRDVDAARELVQATALRAWERRGQYAEQAGKSPMHWLGTIIYSQYANARRAAAIRPTLSLDVMLEQELDPPSDATQDWTVLLRQVGDAIDRLPVEQKQMVFDAAICGGSYDGIAAARALPRSTVGTRLMRARQKLAAIAA